MREDWRSELARQELPEVNLDASQCPACGCALPLVSGACADCGLQLE
jgi:hypothetical protein